MALQLQLPLLCTTRHYTQLQLHYVTLQYTRLHHTIPRYSTQHYSTLQYTTLITPQLQLQLQLQLHYANYITTTTTTCNYNSTTVQLQQHLQLQIQLRYTTLHPAIVVRWPLQPLQPPQKTTPTTFRSISGFALPSVSHNNQPLLSVSYFWNFRHRLARYYWYYGTVWYMRFNCTLFSSTWLLLVNRQNDFLNDCTY